MARYVKLKVYDLSNGLARSMSLALIGKQIDGIWHTGVVVGGTEYFFGQGIQQCPGHLSPFGTPVQTVDMGNTEIPDDMIRDFIEDVSPKFNATTYDLLSNNCNNFSNEMCDFLVGQGIPEHITGLPQEVMNSPGGRHLIQVLQPALQHQFSNVSASGLTPVRTDAPDMLASLPTAAVPAAVEAAPSTSNDAQDTHKKSHAREDYKVALLREFQQVQEQGIRDANRAAAEAIRRVAELVRSGTVMPPQLQMAAVAGMQD